MSKLWPDVLEFVTLVLSLGQFEQVTGEQEAKNPFHEKRGNNVDFVFTLPFYGLFADMAHW